MFVYRFRFDEVTAVSGQNVEFLRFLENLAVEDLDVFNYLPSRKVVVLGTSADNGDKILKYVKNNISYKFEYDECSPEERALVQFEPGCNPQVSVCYMLPLFALESYLEL